MPFAARAVVTPSGARWRVRRRWLSGPVTLPPWRFRETGEIFGWDPGPLVPEGDIYATIALILAVIVVIFLVIPVLVFGIELIVLALTLVGSVVARFVLARPWAIEATDLDTGQTLTWSVTGWRHSERAIAVISAALQSGATLPRPGAT